MTKVLQNRAMHLLGGMAVILLVSLLVYVLKPWITVSEIRSPIYVQTFKASWTLSCGKTFFSDGENQLTLVFPEGGVSPEDTNTIVNGNRFIIRGFRYKQIHKNLISGKIMEKPSPRVDVREWFVETPYYVYVGEGAQTKMISTPQGWRNKNPSPKYAYKGSNIHDC